MRRVVVCAALAALCASPAAAGALPAAGVLVPGLSLGGVRPQDVSTDVRARLGTFYGVCRGCARTTWYFTYKPFDQRGLAVELAAGRVAAVYTLWQPTGWRSSQGLDLGTAEAAVTTLAGPLLTVECDGYRALVRDGRTRRTVYYVADGRLWGFGLFAARETPCR